jgi:hypothetical protein
MAKEPLSRLVERMGRNRTTGKMPEDFQVCREATL